MPLVLHPRSSMDEQTRNVHLAPLQLQQVTPHKLLDVQARLRNRPSIGILREAVQSVDGGERLQQRGFDRRRIVTFAARYGDFV